MIRSRKRRSKSRTWTEPPYLSANEKAVRETCAEIRASNRAHERESLTSAEIDERIIAKIIDCAKAARAVTEADIRAANVPMKEVTHTRRQRCLNLARARFPDLDNRIFAAAA